MGLMNPALANPDSGHPLPPPVCARCGTFLSEGARGPECDACRERQEAARRTRGLYPRWYVLTLGILVNFTIAGVLAALNWRALGDRVRMRNAWIVAAIGAVASAVVITSEVGRLGLLLNVIGSVVAAQGLEPVLKAHFEAGGKRASLLKPVGLILAALILLIAILALFVTDEVTAVGGPVYRIDESE